MRMLDREEAAARARVDQWLRSVDADYASGLATSASTSAMGDLLNNEGLLAAMNSVLLGSRVSAVPNPPPPAPSSSSSSSAAAHGSDVVSRLCGVLFDMYRADEPGFKECVFQLLPAMVCCYLSCLAAGGDVLSAAASKRGPCQSLEVILLGIYNREVYDPDAAAPKHLVKFRFPSLALGSIYHDPSLLQSSMLTESALRRLETGHHVKVGPLPQVARLDSENRSSVLSAVLYCYSCHLTSYGHAGLTSLCVAAARMASQGFPFDPWSRSYQHHRRHSRRSRGCRSTLTDDGGDASLENVSEDDEELDASGSDGEDDEDGGDGERRGRRRRSSGPGVSVGLGSRNNRQPRIPLSPQILLHLLSCVYYALYKGCALPARLAVDAVHKRATFEVLPDVLMASEAVRHAVDASASGSACGADLDSPAVSPTMSIMSALMTNGAANGDGRHGGGVDITANLARPRGSVTQLVGMKNIITNASFRTKKLPDDIPLQDPGLAASSSAAAGAATSGGGAGCVGDASLSSITEERDDNGPPGKEHKESKLGAAKHLLAQSQQILAKAAKEQKNKALKIAGKINPGGGSSSNANTAASPAATSGNEVGASVDGVGIEMTELHLSSDK